MGKLLRRTCLIAGCVVTLGILVTGCSVVEDTASSAAQQLSQAASEELLRQACAPIQDGTIDANELKVLGSIVQSVNGGGLPEPLVDVLRELAEQGDQAPRALQDKLINACADAGVGNGE